MDARNKDKCKQCGQPDHGTAACNTVDDDKPIYNETMDVIESLKTALAERDKELTADTKIVESQEAQIIKLAQEKEQAEARVKDLENIIKGLKNGQQND